MAGLSNGNCTITVGGTVDFGATVSTNGTQITATEVLFRHGNGIAPEIIDLQLEVFINGYPGG